MTYFFCRLWIHKICLFSWNFQFSTKFRLFVHRHYCGNFSFYEKSRLLLRWLYSRNIDFISKMSTFFHRLHSQNFLFFHENFDLKTEIKTKKKKILPVMFFFSCSNPLRYIRHHIEQELVCLPVSPPLLPASRPGRFFLLLLEFPEMTNRPLRL